MNTFSLQIGTPDGLLFDGEVERIKVRAVTGDLAILAGHINYVTALGMGLAYIVLPDGTRREAACIGGMLSVMNGECSVLATTWEWAEDIDQKRRKNETRGDGTRGQVPRPILTGIVSTGRGTCPRVPSPRVLFMIPQL